MGILAQLLDGLGRGNVAHVTDDHALLVEAIPDPPLHEQHTVVLRQYLTTTGAASGTSDMRVAVQTDFYIEAVPDVDRYITTLSWLIADAGATLSQFGAIAALATGCSLFYTRTNGEIVTIADGLNTNFRIVRLCMGEPPFGDGNNSFRANNVVGTSEAFIPVLDLRRLLPPFGLKLQRDTTQRLTFRINDNVAALDALNVIAYGFVRDGA